MPGLMIIAHAPLASSLKAVAEHIFPDCAHVLQALDVPRDMPVEEIETRARAMLERVRDPQALIFTDVYGATPCNVAQHLVDGVQVKLIAGVNVPMLWRSLCYADESLDAVVARALAGAAQGTLQVASAQPPGPSVDACANDQSQRHDQQ